MSGSGSIVEANWTNKQVDGCMDGEDRTNAQAGVRDRQIDYRESVGTHSAGRQTTIDK